MNNKVIRMFKDEVGRKIISEFCWFTAKLYTFKIFDEKEI